MAIASSGRPLLTVSGPLFERLRSYSESAYPYEGCGVLVGNFGVEGTVVLEVVEGHNLITDRRHDRYELDPRDILMAERSARQRGQEVVGFYHTHPDHPARPSQFDTDRAWPGYHYVVVAVDSGKLVRATAWRLREGVEPNQFAEVPLQVPGSDHAYNPGGIVAEKE